MRLHLNFGILGPDGMPLSFAEVQAKARLIENAGFSGIWSGHHIPIPGDTARTLPDPLPGLLIAASATSRVELGTCIYCLGLVNAGNFAQSAYTLEAFAPGRLTFGVGTGSQKQEWDIAGLDWSQRFTRLERRVHLLGGVGHHHDHGENDREQRQVETVRRVGEQLAVEAGCGLGGELVCGLRHACLECRRLTRATRGERGLRAQDDRACSPDRQPARR